MKAMTAREHNLSVAYGLYPVAVSQQANRSWTVTAENGNGERQEIRAAFVIDATELGDVAKMAGVKYDKGMEARAATGEEIAPEAPNHIIQDLTYVAILKDYGRDMTIPRPTGYDAGLYAGCCINPLCTHPKEPDRLRSRKDMISYGALPNGKYMINWPIEGNDFYLDLVDMTRAERTEAVKAAKNFTLGFVYFIQHELGYSHLGLADDEFPTPDRLPFIPYHRESRRIHGDVRFTYNHVKTPYAQTLYRTGIAVGDYPVDHHHTRYTGHETLPRLYFYPIPSYSLPLGTLIPAGFENLLVAEKSISVSNIINGTTRLQPVVMQIGTAAGTLAALSLHHRQSIHQVPVREVQNAILASGGYLQPYLDADKGTEMFGVLQRIGSTGILKGVGRKVEWANQFWLRADTVLLRGELAGLEEAYPCYKAPAGHAGETVSVGEALDAVATVAVHEGLLEKRSVRKRVAAAWKRLYGPTGRKRPVKRGEYARIVDKVLDPFNRLPVNIQGEYLRDGKERQGQ